jgi:hypothetical protein
MAVAIWITVSGLGAEIARAQADDACVVPDDGTGTAELPPPGCDYVSPGDAYRIIDGLPPGTTIELDPRHTAFFCLGTPACGEPGGSLGGERELFESTLVLLLSGTGDLDGFRRTLRVPTMVETHTGPRTPGDPVQSFDADVYNLQGAIFGEPRLRLAPDHGRHRQRPPQPRSHDADRSSRRHLRGR